MKKVFSADIIFLMLFTVSLPMYAMQRPGRRLRPVAKTISSVAKSNKKYKDLLEFINDPNPHRPDYWADTWTGVPEFEDAVDEGWVDKFWIKLDYLKNDDGSPLTEKQKQEIRLYLENHNNSTEPNDTFRFANNNFEVLTGKENKHLWKYMHNFLNRLPCLKERLEGKKVDQPCPKIKKQMADAEKSLQKPPQPNQLQNALSRLEKALQALRTAL